MADTYSNFEELTKSESEGQDFTIKITDRKSNILIMAPHAGGIEQGTSEITLSIAREEFSYYLFEGIKSADNRELHITSTNFDEPQALKIAAESEFIVAIHGEASENDIGYLGGRNTVLQRYLRSSLKNAGFKVLEHDNPRLQGFSAENICNRCASATGGVQLELGRGLRNKFFKSLASVGRKETTDELVNFSNAIRKGLELSDAL